jgi:hypothetical protein
MVSRSGKAAQDPQHVIRGPGVADPDLGGVLLLWLEMDKDSLLV